MKIIANVHLVHEGNIVKPGETFDITKDKADNLIKKGYAEKVQVKAKEADKADKAIEQADNADETSEK